MREDEEGRVREEGSHRVLLGRLRVHEQRELEAVERTRAEAEAAHARKREREPSEAS